MDTKYFIYGVLALCRLAKLGNGRVLKDIFISCYANYTENLSDFDWDKFARYWLMDRHYKGGEAIINSMFENPIICPSISFSYIAQTGIVFTIKTIDTATWQIATRNISVGVRSGNSVILAYTAADGTEYDLKLMILGTDYQYWSVVEACVPGLVTKNAWVWTNRDKISDSMLEPYLEKAGISPSELTLDLNDGNWC